MATNTGDDKYILTGLSKQFHISQLQDHRMELATKKKRIEQKLKRTNRRLENTLIHRRSRAQQELELAKKNLRLAELMCDPNKYLNHGKHLDKQRVQNSRSVSNAVFSEPQIEIPRTTQQRQPTADSIVNEMIRDPVLSYFNKARRLP